jgi:hypothetical protein
MWKRDLSAACIGFAAANTLFAMAHYLSTPRLFIAGLLVVCALAFLTAVIHYAVTVARPTPTEAPATTSGRTVVASTAAA